MDYTISMWCWLCYGWATGGIYKVHRATIGMSSLVRKGHSAGRQVLHLDALLGGALAVPPLFVRLRGVWTRLIILRVATHHRIPAAAHALVHLQDLERHGDQLVPNQLIAVCFLIYTPLSAGEAACVSTGKQEGSYVYWSPACIKFRALPSGGWLKQPATPSSVLWGTTCSEGTLSARLTAVIAFPTHLDEMLAKIPFSHVTWWLLWIDKRWLAN